VLLVDISAIEVPLSKVETHLFQKSIEINSQIVQRSDAKESVMARIGGKVLRYFVQEGQKIKKGQAMVEIESLELSSLFSKLTLLRQQLHVHNKNYKTLKKLYQSGLETVQNLNKEQRERDESSSEIASVQKQLTLMGVSHNNANNSTYMLYAGNAGTVSNILIPTNSVVDSNTPLLSLIKDKNALLVKSFIPLRYASDIQINQKALVHYGNQAYKAHITQILPELDVKSQQMLVLLTLDEEVKNIFVNAFVGTTLFLGKAKKYLAVKKTALNFFKNEWVVFVPKYHQKKDKHDDHEEEEEVPYTAKVIEILEEDQEHVAIEGLEVNEIYVSDKSYFIKTLLLKSSLGGHGH